MKAIEDEFNVHFSLGGYKFVKFNFNEENNAKNKLMNELNNEKFGAEYDEKFGAVIDEHMKK